MLPKPQVELGSAHIDMMPAGSIASPQVIDMGPPPVPAQPASRQPEHPDDHRRTATYYGSSARGAHVRSTRFTREADASDGGGGVPSRSATSNAGLPGAIAEAPAASRSSANAPRTIAAPAPRSRAFVPSAASTSPAAGTSPLAATSGRSAAASSPGSGEFRYLPPLRGLRIIARCYRRQFVIVLKLNGMAHA